MKTEQGIIKKVESDSVLIQLKPKNPESCKSCGCCGTPNSNDHILRLSMKDNPSLKEAKEGNIVTLEINLPNQAIAAALLFGLPLTNMIFFGIAAGILFPQNDPALLIGGAAGLILGGMELTVISRVVPGFKGAIKLQNPVE